MSKDLAYFLPRTNWQDGLKVKLKGLCFIQTSKIKNGNFPFLNVILKEKIPANVFKVLLLNCHFCSNDNMLSVWRVILPEVDVINFFGGKSIFPQN